MRIHWWVYATTAIGLVQFLWICYFYVLCSLVPHYTRVTSLGRMNTWCTMLTESFRNMWYRMLFHEAKHTLTLLVQVMLVLTQQLLLLTLRLQPSIHQVQQVQPPLLQMHAVRPPVLQLLPPTLQVQQVWPLVPQV